MLEADWSWRQQTAARLGGRAIQRRLSTFCGTKRDGYPRNCEWSYLRQADSPEQQGISNSSAADGSAFVGHRSRNEARIAIHSAK
jgi:hypothetical protein